MENPIKTLHDNEMAYEYMAHKTGLHINTIYNLAKFTPEQAGNMAVKNVILLKSKLAVDFWKYFKNN